MTQITEYTLVQANTNELLCAAINEAIKKGWQPLDAPFVRLSPNVLCQTMVKYKSVVREERLAPGFNYGIEGV